MEFTIVAETEHTNPERAARPIDRTRLAGGLAANLGRMLAGRDHLILRLQAFIQSTFESLSAWLGGTVLWRYISSTLLRRIIVSNLLGLIVLFFGVLYLSQFNVWLIDAKRQSLQSQSQIVAGAIASTLSTSDTFDGAGGERLSLGDDPFADIVFSLGPEQVTPILRRLLAGTQNEARVYDRRGNLVAHSKRLLPPPGLNSAGDEQARQNRPTTKNFWTRLQQWFLSSDLRVYKELGDANGQLYPEVRKALRGKSEALLLLTGSGKQIVSVATPIERAGSVQGVLLLSTRPGEVDDALAEERLGIFALALVALCAAVLASYLLARTVAGPMRDLSLAAEDVTQNIRSSKHLPELEGRDDEVGQLARSFRTMTDALYRRIEASEKFAADVAHELKNPLTAARSTAESLTYAKTDAQRDGLVVQIQEELKRLNKLITDISNASRMDAELALHTPLPVDLAEIVSGVAESFRALLADDSKRLALDIDGADAAVGAFTVAGHDGRLAQVVTNLVDNALSFSPDGGCVNVIVRREDAYILVAVADQGPGIQSDKLETIFERFYTYRPTELSSRGNNSGLGLAISKEIVQAHRGDIWAENIVSDDSQASVLGARFVLRLPAMEGGQKSSRRARRHGRKL
ncbi:MAG: stimulus-sensing domain-containing protein [Hyphomicrobiaceae bacterium]